MFVRAASDIPSMASDDVWCCCFLLAKENSQHVCTSPCAPDGAVYTPITFSRVSYVPPDAQRAIHCSSSFRQCSAIPAAPFRSQTRRKLVRRPQPRAPCSPAKAGACWPDAGRLYQVARRHAAVAPTFVRADSASCPTSTRRTQPSAQQTARRCCARSLLLACQARPPATACARTHRSCVHLRSHG